MNRRIGFLLPKIAGITLIAGLGAVVLFLVFKLLLVALTVTALVIGIGAIVKNYRQYRLGNQASFLPQVSGIVPVAPAKSHNGAIIPIN